METLVTFGLGAGTVLIIIGVVVMFKLVKQVKELETSLSSTIDVIYQNEQMLNRRIDQEIDRVDQITNNIYSVIDSRLDKLETKITNNKQVLRG
jgi:predicted PurR-regulated permease PerM